MALVSVFTYALPSATAVCALQTLAGAGSVSINGDYSYTLPVPGNAALATVSNNYENSTPSPYTGSTVSAAKFPGFSRTVSITSANNLSARNFTITGTLNGQAVSEVVAGPNANTVRTVGLYSVVTAVTVSGAAAAVSLGDTVSTVAGATFLGITDWFMSDTYLTTPSMAIQVNVTGTIKYDFLTTLDDVTTVPFVSQAQFTPIAGMTNATTDQLAVYTTPARFSCIVVDPNGTDNTGTLVATFVQQGTM